MSVTFKVPGETSAIVVTSKHIRQCLWPRIIFSRATHVLKESLLSHGLGYEGQDQFQIGNSDPDSELESDE